MHERWTTDAFLLIFLTSSQKDLQKESEAFRLLRFAYGAFELVGFVHLCFDCCRGSLIVEKCLAIFPRENYEKKKPVST